MNHFLSYPADNNNRLLYGNGFFAKLTIFCLVPSWRQFSASYQADNKTWLTGFR